MFNVEKMDALEEAPDLNGGGPVTKIGILNCECCAIKFVANTYAIYANGKPIISCRNDNWSTTNAFVQTMKAAYGDEFVLDKNYPKSK